MRVDATIVFEIKDGDAITVYIPNATPATVNDVNANAFRNGWWSGPSSSGTFYPASRLYSAAVTYRAHCGHDECAKPYGKPRELFAGADLRDHAHELPAPTPTLVPKKKADSKPASKHGSSRPRK